MSVYTLLRREDILCRYQLPAQTLPVTGATGLHSVGAVDEDVVQDLTTSTLCLDIIEVTWIAIVLIRAPGISYLL